VTLYDRIGVGYAQHRRPDPRVAARLHAALGDARTVLNVGAGAGSYEPTGGGVIAVEPASTMIRQRPVGAAPVVQATAEHLPFADDSFDAALAVFTVHHWTDRGRGLAEVRRVVRGPVVVLTWDPDVGDRFWLVHDYVPATKALDHGAPRPQEIADALGGGRVETLLTPHDCVDGFFACYWRRPEAYLDPGVRAAISGLARLDPDDLEPGMARLATDLADGTWRRRHGLLLDQDAYDAGHRIIVSPGPR
jgi:SAM-dependent methyltransferase